MCFRVTLVLPYFLPFPFLATAISPRPPGRGNWNEQGRRGKPIYLGTTCACNIKECAVTTAAARRWESPYCGKDRSWGPCICESAPALPLC
ncbi:hypothetical protein F5883DRAFT_563396 [Diaporthe sp. PMI_573]|nr:hypothetical protein F5883DRAFT_563396 [Diaporthaceae sp. PMI_573]